MTDYNDLSVKGLVESAKAIYGDTPMAKLAATQAILESGLYKGKPSRLAKEGYNLFGIKGQGNAGSINLPTTEHVGMDNIKIDADFAKYSDYKSSFEGHKKLMSKQRYANVWNARNEYEAFQSVKDAGYATDRNYPNLLSSVYDKYVSQYFNPPQE